MRFLRSEAGAVVLWVACSLVLAATVVPWMVSAGQWLVALSETRDLPGFLDSVASSARRARFGRYFNRSLMLSALVLMPFLIHRLRVLKAVRGPVVANSRVRTPWRLALLQLATGLVIAAGLLWAMGVALELAGAFERTREMPGWSRLFSRAVVPAIGASVVEEWLFRGLLLGVWLRIARPWSACLGTSLVFAFVHFLEPPGAVMENPTSPVAGFIALGRILLHFTEPTFFVADFATLFVVGLILAGARLRTGALWFSIGLHAGWVFAFKGFNLMHQTLPDSPLHPLGVGSDLRSGLIPLLALAVTAGVCHVVLAKLPQPPGVPRA
jgi:uncharacterized protein